MATRQGFALHIDSHLRPLLQGLKTLVYHTLFTPQHQQGLLDKILLV